MFNFFFCSNIYCALTACALSSSCVTIACNIITVAVALLQSLLSFRVAACAELPQTDCNYSTSTLTRRHVHNYVFSHECTDVCVHVYIFMKHIYVCAPNSAQLHLLLDGSATTVQQLVSEVTLTFRELLPPPCCCRRSFTNFYCHHSYARLVACSRRPVSNVVAVPNVIYSTKISLPHNVCHKFTHFLILSSFVARFSLQLPLKLPLTHTKCELLHICELYIIAVNWCNEVMDCGL